MSIIWILILGILAGWVWVLTERINKLEKQLRSTTPEATPQTKDAQDVAARLIDKHVQEFHKRR